MPDKPANELQWALQKDGSTLIDFTSMLELSIQHDSSIPEEAIEQGSFATYNRTHSPDSIRVKLAIEGEAADLQKAQETLDSLASGTDKVSLVTPDYEHENLALESYDYSRNQQQSSGILIVDLRLKEVREVVTQQVTVQTSKPITTTSAKEASTVSKTETGKTQTQEPEQKTKKSLALKISENL